MLRDAAANAGYVLSSVRELRGAGRAAANAPAYLFKWHGRCKWKAAPAQRRVDHHLETEMANEQKSSNEQKKGTSEREERAERKNENRQENREERNREERNREERKEQRR
jgi:hypothetical protein